MPCRSSYFYVIPTDNLDSRVITISEERESDDWLLRDWDASRDIELLPTD